MLSHTLFYLQVAGFYFIIGAFFGGFSAYHTHAYLFIRNNAFYVFTANFQFIGLSACAASYLMWNMYLASLDKIADSKVFRLFILLVLDCPPMSAEENRVGLKIVSITNADGDYKIRWECADNLRGNEAYMFSLMRFFDPDDFSNNYQPFTISDGEIHYEFKKGDELTYMEFRVSDFEPECGVMYMYFAGATADMGAPPEIQTEPLFFTFVLGEQPELVENMPRLANGIFDSYIEL